MRLETKYGVLEGTVEEFRELLEDKVDLSYLSGEADCSWVEENKSGYYIVNNDNARCALNSGRHVPKGLILEHLIGDGYVDTMGNHYILHDEDLDDYNKTWVEGKFNMYKDNDWLLVQKEEYKVVKEDKYKVVKEDIYSLVDGNKVLEKGTVLLETEYNYEDSLGERFIINPETVENKLIDICDSRTGFHFEGNKRNNKLFKVGLPQNQF